MLFIKKILKELAIQIDLLNELSEHNGFDIFILEKLKIGLNKKLEKIFLSILLWNGVQYVLL